MAMRDNLILDGDSYKDSHHALYPPNMTNMYSYFESRGGLFTETVFFGLQYILESCLSEQAITRFNIEEAREFVADHIGPGVFNERDWAYILTRHSGRLPVRIRAIPEGTVVPTRNALFTIENKDPALAWLTNYLETVLSQVWYPCTVATLVRAIKYILLAVLERTGTPSLIDYMLNDFGVRGSTSRESAAIGGAAHLVNFRGTDNQPALRLIREYYGERMAGNSVVATEHSTMMAWGRNGEADAVKNMLRKFPNQIVACVGDTYDIYDFCRMLYLDDEIRTMIKARNHPFVVRPDSGDPRKVWPEVFDLLMGGFGFTVNHKGYRVLPPYLRSLWGDGIDLWSIRDVTKHMTDCGISADNYLFGSGGGILQMVNRDTSKYAIKSSQVTVDGEVRDICKTPTTDTVKLSKAGRFVVYRNDDGRLVTGHPGDCRLDRDQLVTVFEDGEVVNSYDLTGIRERARVDTRGEWPVLST